MGQRHQVFVKIVNPVKYLRDPKKELVKQFGTKEYSILAYHNQWLYGRSALANCIRLLNFGKQFTKEEKTSDKGFGCYQSPICPKGIEANFQTTKELVEAIGFIMNYNAVKTPFTDAGIGNSYYIGKLDEGINFDFTLGDNNDGITIIDVVENKYCFMNIYDQEKKSYSVRDLKQNIPYHAKDYVRAYYGETKSSINPYYIEKKTDKQIANVLSSNIRYNAKCIKPFEKFEVLSIEEVKSMFPEMEIFKPIQKGMKIKMM